MVSPRRLLAVGSMALSLSGVGAATQAGAAAGVDEEARRLFVEGTASYEKGDSAAALEKLQRAYALAPRAVILPNLAAAAADLEQWQTAAEACAEFLASQDAPQQFREPVEALLRKVRPHVGRLEVTVEPEGVRVLLDGKVVPPHRFGAIYVEPGVHTLAGVIQGRRVARRVRVAKGAAVAILLEVRHPAASETTAPETAETTPDDSAPVDDEQPSTSAKSGRDTLGYVLVAGGGVGLVVAGLAYSAHSSAVGSLERRCIDGYCPSSERDTIDEAESYGTLSILSLVLGAASAGAGLLVLWPPGDERRVAGAAGFDFSVTPGPGGATARAHLSF